jgi:hypothetical protein
MASVANGAYHAALGAPKSKQTEAASEANVLFKRVSAALESLPTDTGMAEMGAIATEQVSKVRDLSKEVLNKCMGF